MRHQQSGCLWWYWIGSIRNMLESFATPAEQISKTQNDWIGDGALKERITSWRGGFKLLQSDVPVRSCARKERGDVKRKKPEWLFFQVYISTLECNRIQPSLPYRIYFYFVVGIIYRPPRSELVIDQLSRHMLICSSFPKRLVTYSSIERCPFLPPLRSASRRVVCLSGASSIVEDFEIFSRMAFCNEHILWTVSSRILNFVYLFMVILDEIRKDLKWHLTDLELWWTRNIPLLEERHLSLPFHFQSEDSDTYAIDRASNLKSYISECIYIQLPPLSWKKIRVFFILCFHCRVEVTVGSSTSVYGDIVEWRTHHTQLKWRGKNDPSFSLLCLHDWRSE